MLAYYRSAPNWAVRPQYGAALAINVFSFDNDHMLANEVCRSPSRAIVNDDRNGNFQNGTHYTANLHDGHQLIAKFMRGTDVWLQTEVDLISRYVRFGSKPDIHGLVSDVRCWG